MQAGAGGLANGIEPRQVGSPGAVNEDAAAGVVGRGHHRDGLPGDVDAELQAAAVDGGEVLADELRGTVADVQLHAVRAEALHLVVDGAGHDVPGGQLATRVETLHEGLAVRQQQPAALATHRLADQERPRPGMEQAGGVKLIEFQVGDPAAGPPGHGDAVAGGALRVGAVQVGLAGAAAGQHHRARGQGTHAGVAGIQYVGPQASVRTVAQAPGGDQVHRHLVLQNADIRPLQGPRQEGGFNGPPGMVGGMNDTTVTVASLPVQMQHRLAVIAGPGGEGHLLLKEPLHRLRGALGHLADRRRIAQSGAGLQGVGYMGVYGIPGLQHRGHAPLGVEARALGHGPLGQQRDPQTLRQPQGHGEPGDAAADDQNVCCFLAGSHCLECHRADRLRCLPPFRSRGTAPCFGAGCSPGKNYKPLPDLAANYP